MTEKPGLAGPLTGWQVPFRLAQRLQDWPTSWLSERLVGYPGGEVAVCLAGLSVLLLGRGADPSGPDRAGPGADCSD